MALPVYQASGTRVVAAGAGGSPAWPTHQADDVAFLVVETANEAVTLSDAQGFVEVPSSPQGTGTAGGTSATRLTIFWKRATGSSEAAPTIANPGDHINAQIHTFRGCATSGDPWDVMNGGVDATSDFSLDATGQTTTVADCLIALFVGVDSDATTPRWSGHANADLANLTERVDQCTNQGNGGGQMLTTGEKATAGAYGTTTATAGSNTVKAWVGIALKPPSGSSVDGSASLSGSGTLGLVGSLILAGALALTGTGTLAATGSVDRNGAAALAGTATLAAAASMDRGGAVSLQGSATLTAAITTRFQLPRDGPAYDVQSPVDPALAAWDDTSETAYRPGRPWRMSPDRAPVSNGSGPECIQANIVGELETALILAWISDPCIAQTIGGAGWTLKGVVRAIMDFADCEHSRVICSLKVVSLDGLTLRGTLLTLGFYGTEGPYAISPSDPQNRFIANGAALAQVDLLGGDRIMLELGSSPTNAPLLGDFVCFYVGDSAGTDLAENETATDARDPWIQISKEIIFSPTHTGAAALSGSATLMASGSVERAGAAALSASATLAAAGSVDRGGAAVLAGVATLAAAGTVETTTPRAGSDVHLVNELGDVHLAQELGDVQIEDRVGDVLITEPLGDVIRVDLLDRDAARPDPI